MKTFLLSLVILTSLANALPFSFWKPAASSGSYTPMVLTPIVWLDASDSATLLNSSGTPAGSGVAIEQWTDKSGNGKNAVKTTSNRPYRQLAIQNGKDAVWFEEASLSYMTFATPPLSGATAAFVAFVAKRDYETPASGYNSIAPLSKWGNTGDYDLYPWPDGVIYDGFASSTRKTIGNPTPLLASAQVVSIVSGPSDYRYRMGGNVLHSTATNTVAIGTAPTLGAEPGSGWAFPGHIMEIVVLNYIPTAPQIAALESYLITKWGL